MAIITPLFLQIDLVYNANSLGLLARDVVRGGVTTSGGMLVSQRGAGANMSVDVAAGVAWVPGTESPGQPTYRVRNDATENVAISGADPTNPRVDVVAIQVRDSAFSGADDDGRIIVVQGTAASSPAVPSLPANAIPLAYVAVGAQVTEIIAANITDMRQPGGGTWTTGAVEYMDATAAPWGALVLDGSTFDAARYPRLYAARSNNNVLRDARSRALIGTGQGSGLTNRSLGDTTGVETHTLTAAQSGLRGHNHTQNAHTHAVAIRVGFSGGGVTVVSGFESSASPNAFTTSSSAAAETLATNNAVAAQNASEAHPNMQPSLALLPIIWT